MTLFVSEFHLDLFYKLHPISMYCFVVFIENGEFGCCESSWTRRSCHGFETAKSGARYNVMFTTSTQCVEELRAVVCEGEGRMCCVVEELIEKVIWMIHSLNTEHLVYVCACVCE